MGVARHEGRDVLLELAVPDSDDRVLLLEYDAGTQPDPNLVRVDPSGNVRWRAQLPDPGSADTYVDAQWDHGRLVATSWSSYAADLDPETGLIRSMVWTK